MYGLPRHSLVDGPAADSLAQYQFRSDRDFASIQHRVGAYLERRSVVVLELVSDP